MEEICGFDLCLNEGRLDLQNCRDNGSSSSHLLSVSACNLKAVGSLVSFAFGVGLCPDCRPCTWPIGVHHVGLAGGRRNKIQINLLQITAKCCRITLILKCWIYTSTGIQWRLQKPLYHWTWRVSSIKADENWLSINSCLPQSIRMCYRCPNWRHHGFFASRLHFWIRLQTPEWWLAHRPAGSPVLSINCHSVNLIKAL